MIIDGSDKSLVMACIGLAVRSGRQLWAHNATYDAGALYKAYQARLRNLRCSLTLVKTFDPDIIDSRRGSLKDLRPDTRAALSKLAHHWSQKTGQPVDIARDRSWVAAAVAGMQPDDSVLLEYVATDSVECARLVAEWAEAVGAPSEEWDLGLMETEVEDVWRWPAARGYRVDRDMLEDKMRELSTKRQESVERFGIDLTTNSHATRQWLASRGIRVQDREGKATLSHKHFGRAFVPKDADDDWRAFKQIREAAGTANKLNEIAEKQVDGRIYPTIRGIGAQTGRMSISRPAIQNLQGSLRSLLVAEPGHVLVGCDLNRVEPCVIAAMSQDADLIEGVKGDVYTELGVAVYGEESRGDPSSRKIAKTAFLAIAYGQGRAALAANLGLAEGEAAGVIRRLKASYPAMTRWMAGIKADASNGRSLTTAYGRRLPRTPEHPYRAVNWVIQGTAADLFKRNTLKAAAGLHRDALFLPVHDELIVQVPRGEEEKAMAVLEDAMTSELHGVPIGGTPVILGDQLGHA
ncbi:DNA polymerase [Arthrobacter zhaoguopingii]|uniref:DNA polymerase n=1 Tax=Arthrobacter zhaoguopingii TaxID=2681491 RepID=UPI00135AE873|nr:DNA polymerase [Arthrobacter zhaoguopingii]